MTLDGSLHTKAESGQCILDGRSATGAGVALTVGGNGSIVVQLSDGVVKGSADGRTIQTDPMCSAVLQNPGLHHFGVIVDAGPMLLTLSVDGVVCDGGHAPGPNGMWDKGWFWLPTQLGAPNGAATFQIGECNPSFRGTDCATYTGSVHGGYIWQRALRNSEMVGLARHQLAPLPRFRLPALPRSSRAIVDVSTIAGCNGNGVTDCTRGFRAATAYLENQGGGTLLVPAGTFLTGGFNLSSGTTLALHGTILGIANASEYFYPAVAPLPSFGTGRNGEPGRMHPLVWAIEAASVTITGDGAIDGQGAYFWHRNNKLERPHLLELYNCTNAEVSWITLRNSAFWTLHPVYSRGVHIHHVQIEAPPSSPNTDGIDPDSSIDVLIEYCNISCGDDHIAIKSGLDAAGRAFGRPSVRIATHFSRLFKNLIYGVVSTYQYRYCVALLTEGECALTTGLHPICYCSRTSPCDTATCGVDVAYRLDPR